MITSKHTIGSVSYPILIAVCILTASIFSIITYFIVRTVDKNSVKTENHISSKQKAFSSTITKVPITSKTPVSVSPEKEKAVLTPSSSVYIPRISLISGWKRYTNEEGNFTFQMPENWEMTLCKVDYTNTTSEVKMPFVSLEIITGLISRDKEYECRSSSDPIAFSDISIAFLKDDLESLLNIFDKERKLKVVNVQVGNVGKIGKRLYTDWCEGYEKGEPNPVCDPITGAPNMFIYIPHTLSSDPDYKYLEVSYPAYELEKEIDKMLSTFEFY